MYINRMKSPFLSQKRAITTFLSRKFIITRSLIALEDFLDSSITPQGMPPCRPLRSAGCVQTLSFATSFS